MTDTVLAALMGTEHVSPDGLGHPDQPENMLAPGTAVSTTVLPAVKLATQVAPHEMPMGDDVTLPPPLLMTVRGSANRAVTFFTWFIKTVQVFPAVESQPTQASNVSLTPGVAVRTTVPPVGNRLLHVAPQLMPAGAEVTVPLPWRETLIA